VLFNTGPYTVLLDNSILITANMQSETGFPSSHQLKSYVASKSRLKLAVRAVQSADAGLLVSSPNLSRRRLDVCHTSRHGVALVRISDAGVKGGARGSLKMQDAKTRQKVAICAPSYNFDGLYLGN